MEEKEYLFLGKNMETISKYYGIFLILWGIIISLLSGTKSPTALIPSFLGALILIPAYLSIKFPEKKKLYMHIVVAVGLLIFLGGFRVLSNLGALFQDRFWADISQIMMIITGGIFTYLCVQSFIFARKNK